MVIDFFVYIDPRDPRDVREHVRSEREEISELMEVPRSHGMKKSHGNLSINAVQIKTFGL